MLIIRAMKQAALIQAIEIAGGASALANALGISQEAVSQWRRVPHGRVFAVERLTGVSRHELRPDVYPLEDANPHEVVG